MLRVILLLWFFFLLATMYSDIQKRFRGGRTTEITRSVCTNKPLCRYYRRRRAQTLGSRGTEIILVGTG